MRVIFDVETSRFPDGNPYRASSELISWAIRTGKEDSFGYYTEADFLPRLRELLSKATLLVVINGKFDIGWASRLGIEIPEGTRVWDCQLAEYVLSGQQSSFASMDSLCERYSIEQKEDVVKGYWDRGIETKDIPRDVVQLYNCGDIERTSSIYEAQQTDSRLTPELKKLILLQGADLLVLQQMEENGIVYDSKASLQAGNDTQAELYLINKELDVHVEPKPVDFNWDSGDWLSCFLYGGYMEQEEWESFPAVIQSGPNKGLEYVRRKRIGTATISYAGLFKPLKRSEVKKSTDERKFWSVAEPILRQLKGGGKTGKRVIELLLRRSELGKLADTYYFKLPALIDSMEWGTTLHPTYHQVVARTGRLSSAKPNAQNMPEEVDRFCLSRFAD